MIAAAKEDVARGAISWHHDRAGKSAPHFLEKGNSSGRYNEMMKETCHRLPSPKGKIQGSFLCKASCPVLRLNVEDGEWDVCYTQVSERYMELKVLTLTYKEGATITINLPKIFAHRLK